MFKSKHSRIHIIPYAYADQVEKYSSAYTKDGKTKARGSGAVLENSIAVGNDRAGPGRDGVVGIANRHELDDSRF